MVTFIIPTLWKSECIYKTIDAIQASTISGIELFIFDNAKSGYESPDSRIKVVNDKDYWVNPAWNRGVELASNEWICLLNDDIHVNVDLLCKTFKRDVIDKPEVVSSFGNLGYKTSQPFYEEINGDNEELNVIPQPFKGNGYGQLIIINKKDWSPIPEYFRVYFGDDFIHYVTENLLQKQSLCFDNLKAIGQYSATSREIEYILQQEFTFWNKAVNDIRDKLTNN
jgi:hypothetical protein